MTYISPRNIKIDKKVTSLIESDLETYSRILRLSGG